MLVATFVLLTTFVTTSNAFAQEPLPLTLIPDLSCPLCKIEKAPVPVIVDPPVLIKEVKPAQPMVDAWYFVEYGHNARVRGPFSSKEECNTVRRSADDPDRCFLQMRQRYID